VDRERVTMPDSETPPGFGSFFYPVPGVFHPGPIADIPPGCRDRAWDIRPIQDRGGGSHRFRTAADVRVDPCTDLRLP